MFWHCSCTLLQFDRQFGLAVALLVMVAAVVGGAPTTRQDDWQLAACVLQIIMQLVTVELCAKRTFSAANTPVGIATIANAKTTTIGTRITASSASRPAS
jgi:hypothetical protein